MAEAKYLLCAFAGPPRFDGGEETFTYRALDAQGSQIGKDQELTAVDAKLLRRAFNLDKISAQAALALPTRNRAHTSA